MDDKLEVATLHVTDVDAAPTRTVTLAAGTESYS